MGRRKSSGKLLSDIDTFASQLLKRAGVSKVTPPEGDLSGEQGPLAVEAKIAEQVSVLTAVTRWVQVKHKIDPDDDEPGDFISRARKKLNGGTSGHRSRPTPAENRPFAIGADRDAVGDDGGTEE